MGLFDSLQTSYTPSNVDNIEKSQYEVLRSHEAAKVPTSLFNPFRVGGPYHLSRPGVLPRVTDIEALQASLLPDGPKPKLFLSAFAP